MTTLDLDGVRYQFNVVLEMDSVSVSLPEEVRGGGVRLEVVHDDGETRVEVTCMVAAAQIASEASVAELVTAWVTPTAEYVAAGILDGAEEP